MWYIIIIYKTCIILFKFFATIIIFTPSNISEIDVSLEAAISSQ